MTHLIINAFLLGVVGGFVPGPILTMGFSEGVRGGFKSGVRVILWAFLMESVIALIILLAFSLLSSQSIIFSYISIIGGIVLLYFSYLIFQTKNFSLESEKSFFSVKKIFLLTIFNGGLYIFWITICVPLAIEMDKIIFAGRWLYLFLFELGWIFAMFVVVSLSVLARQWVNNAKRLKNFFYFIAICLFFFGLRMIYGGISNF